MHPKIHLFSLVFRHFFQFVQTFFVYDLGEAVYTRIRQNKTHFKKPERIVTHIYVSPQRLYSNFI